MTLEGDTMRQPRRDRRTSRGPRRAATAAFVAAVALIAAACGSPQAEPEPEAIDGPEEPADSDPEAEENGADEQLEAIRFRYGGSSPAIWPHGWIAEGMGLWEEYGLEGSADQFALGVEAMSAMLGGSTDIAPLSPLPTLNAALAGEDIRMFACTSTWSNWRLTARTDANINEPEDLVGASVGTARGTNMEYIFLHFLEENSIDPDSVEIVDVRPPDVASAFGGGSVDAVWYPPPFVLTAEASVDGDFTQIDFPFDALYCLTTTQEILDENEEAFRRLMRMFRDIDQMIAEQPDEMARVLEDVAQENPELVQDLWEREFTFETVTPPPRDLVLAEMELYMPFLEEDGAVPEGFELDIDEILVDLS
jgi:ABC-type nitrate/sulfonate/bicarbonate transport system substrate-binding protein